MSMCGINGCSPCGSAINTGTCCQNKRRKELLLTLLERLFAQEDIEERLTDLEARVTALEN